MVAAFWPPGLLEIGLSSGLAALAYLAMEELLVEVHKEPETHIAKEIFFVGFLTFLLIGILNNQTLRSDSAKLLAP